MKDVLLQNLQVALDSADAAVKAVAAGAGLAAVSENITLPPLFVAKGSAATTMSTASTSAIASVPRITAAATLAVAAAAATAAIRSASPSFRAISPSVVGTHSSSSAAQASPALVHEEKKRKVGKRMK